MINRRELLRLLAGAPVAAAAGIEMSRSTISTFQLFELFPDEETARQYLESRLWPNGPVCPDCKSGERVSTLSACATRLCPTLSLDSLVGFA